MSINAILAMDDNMGIGFENRLPWPTNKKDMKWFSDNTRGHVVVMGRKTWESLGSHPLPNRINIVISSQKIEGADAVLSGDMEVVLHQILNRYPDLHIWFIGGADIYRQALPFCDKIYVTKINGVYKCDTFMYNQDFEGFDRLEYVDSDGTMTISIRSRQ